MKPISQTLDKLVKADKQQNNLKNLYQNIGTRVSKLKEINEVYQQKMVNQNMLVKLNNTKGPPIDKYTHQCKLGEGTFGTVEKVIHNEIS